MPKFVYEDVPLFQGLIEDLFPGLSCDRVGYDDLKEKTLQVLETGKFLKKENEELKKVYDDQINKVVQLYETMLTRHTTMVVGPTGAGKSVIINTLKESL